MAYTLYGTLRSRAFRVGWMLEELGVDYEIVHAKPQSPEIRAVSPLGKVPALGDGDAVIPDSSAILTYLADKHGALTYPAGSVERARQDAWTFRILDEFDALLWTAAKHAFILPEEARSEAAKEAAMGEFARNMERLAGELSGPFVTGEQMTVPDIILVHCWGWSAVAKFPKAPETVLAYVDGLRGRAAYKATQSKTR